MTEATPAPDLKTADIARIMKLLPHRYPFLLIDRMYDLNGEESGVAVKNVTINEPFFPGHFPGRPLMPGVLILEALAQTAGILAFQTAGVYPDEKSKFYFVGMDDVRFRKPVQPGDQLILIAEFQRAVRGIWKFSTRAEVEGVKVCSADMMVAPDTGN